MGVLKTTNKIFTTIVLVSIVLLFANSLFFGHYHKTATGAVIFHFHPYNSNTDDAPYKSHHHSESEYLFYASISNLNYLIAFALTLFFLYLNGKKKYFVYNSTIKSCALSRFIHLRAPPAL